MDGDDDCNGNSNDDKASAALLVLSRSSYSYDSVGEAREMATVVKVRR